MAYGCYLSLFPADPFCGPDSARPKSAHGMLSSLLFCPALSAPSIPLVCLFIFFYLEPSPFSTSSPQLTPFPLISDIISLFTRGSHTCPRQGRAPTSLHPHLFILHAISRAIVWLPTYHNPWSRCLFTLFVCGLRWHLPPLAARQSYHKGGRFKLYQ